MKAFELREFRLDALVETERPEPVCGPGEIVVRVRAAALNYRDLAIARGEYGRFALPLVLGSDAVGEVVAVGPGVSRFAVGDRVCPHDTPDWITGPVDEERGRRRLGGPLSGVLTERMVVHQEAAVRAPSHLTDEEAATLCGAGVTAWQTLFEAPCVCPGQTVLVQGTGGVSTFAVQLARLAGARVIVVSRSADKLARMRELGATHTIDTAMHPDWPVEVLRHTEGSGADLVIDVLGGPELGRSIAAARVGGQVCVVGFVAGSSATIDLPSAIRRGVSLRTTTGRSRDSFEKLVRALEVNRVQPLVDRVFAWREALEAFRYLERGKPFGKVVIAVDS